MGRDGPPFYLDEYIEDCIDLANKVTDYFPLLECLDLLAGLDLWQAPKTIGRMRCLKSLRWRFPWDCVAGNVKEGEDLNERVRLDASLAGRHVGIAIEEVQYLHGVDDMKQDLDGFNFHFGSV